MNTTLDLLSEDDHFKITQIRSKHDDLRKRLIEMGFHRGTTGQVIRKAPLGDPIQIRLLGYDVSLRKSEAENIHVEKIQQDQK